MRILNNGTLCVFCYQLFLKAQSLKNIKQSGIVATSHISCMLHENPYLTMEVYTKDGTMERVSTHIFCICYQSQELRRTYFPKQIVIFLNPSNLQECSKQEGLFAWKVGLHKLYSSRDRQENNKVYTCP